MHYDIGRLLIWSYLQFFLKNALDATYNSWIYYDSSFVLIPLRLVILILHLLAFCARKISKVMSVGLCGVSCALKNGLTRFNSHSDNALSHRLTRLRFPCIWNWMVRQCTLLSIPFVCSNRTIERYFSLPDWNRLNLLLLFRSKLLHFGCVDPL